VVGGGGGEEYSASAYRPFKQIKFEIKFEGIL
jgi:hypothetical protein